MSTKRLPDFLIIGAGKSGTTSLDKYLAQHPDIFMSHIKEPNFFAYLHLDPDIFKSLPETHSHYLNSIREWEDYYRLFNNAKEDQLIGETSNTYMTVPNAVKNISRYIPNVKLIAILRNPADRLYSRYLHLTRDKRLKNYSFEQVFDKGSIWWERNDLVKEGFYYQNLKPFFDKFDARNIKIILFDDFVKDSLRIVNQVFEFLNVSAISDLHTDIEYNPSGIIKNEIVNQIVGHESILMKGAKMVLNDHYYSKIKNNLFIQNLVTKFRKSNLHKPKMDSEIRQRILGDIYMEDIIKLEKLIDRDLFNWKFQK